MRQTIEETLEEFAERISTKAIQIRLSPKSHRKLCEELSKEMDTEIKEVKTFLGFPVVVRYGIPDNTAFLVPIKEESRKMKSE